jgi:hypothetical protein
VFCIDCEKTTKKMRCKLCPNEFIDDIDSTDILCNDCDEKSKNCIDCKHKFIPKNINLLQVGNWKRIGINTQVF